MMTTATSLLPSISGLGLVLEALEFRIGGKTSSPCRTGESRKGSSPQRTPGAVADDTLLLRVQVFRTLTTESALA